MKLEIDFALYFNSLGNELNREIPLQCASPAYDFANDATMLNLISYALAKLMVNDLKRAVY